MGGLQSLVVLVFGAADLRRWTLHRGHDRGGGMHLSVAIELCLYLRPLYWRCMKYGTLFLWYNSARGVREACEGKESHPTLSSLPL